MEGRLLPLLSQREKYFLKTETGSVLCKFNLLSFSI